MFIYKLIVVKELFPSPHQLLPHNDRRDATSSSAPHPSRILSTLLFPIDSTLTAPPHPHYSSRGASVPNPGYDLIQFTSFQDEGNSFLCTGPCCCSRPLLLLLLWSRTLYRRNYFIFFNNPDSGIMLN